MSYTWIDLDDIDNNKTKIKTTHMNIFRRNADQLVDDVSCYSDNTTDKKYNLTNHKSGNKRTQRSNDENARRNAYNGSEDTSQVNTAKEIFKNIRRDSKVDPHKHDVRWADWKVAKCESLHSGNNHNNKEPQHYALHYGDGTHVSPCSTYYSGKRHSLYDWNT